MNELEKIAAHNAELRECVELAESLPSVPQGTIEITDNGSFDVANYEKAEVSVVGKLPSVIDASATELTEKDFGNITKIRAYAFYACEQIANIVMPDTIEHIGSYAFCWCNRTKSLKLSKNCTTIQSYVFNNCYGLTSIELPDALTTLGARALSQINKIKDIKIPTGVTTITEGLCYGDTSLKAFDLSDYNIDNLPSLANVSAFTSTPTDMKIIVPIGGKSKLEAMTNWSNFADKILEFSKDEGTIGLQTEVGSISGYDQPFVCVGYLHYPDKSHPYVVIPPDKLLGNDYYDVLGVSASAFEGNTNIVRVYLNNVRHIGDYAFRNCTSLTYVDAPNVTEIGRDAFTKCNLINIELPELLRPANDVFVGCASLKRANLGKANNIANYCFTNCTSFDTLILPNSANVTTLANINAFSNTPMASGNGYVYVPRALIESYKTATNWSVFANQFRAIEDYPNI